MFESLEKNALEQIDIVEKLIKKHNEYIESEAGSSATGIKLYATSSCLTRLYGIYEHFVDSIITDYLDALPELILYENLPDVIKSEYRIGMSHLLGQVGNGRYSGLNHEQIILSYHEALTNNPKYQFVTQALTRHERNLRLQIVETIIARLDLKELRGWLNNCAEIIDLFEDKDAISDQLEAEINNFVQSRNDAAHGSLTEALGHTILQRYCSLIKEIVKAFAGFFRKHLLNHRIIAKKTIKIGNVSEVFNKAGTFIIKLNFNRSLMVGSLIYLVKPNHCSSEIINNLMLDNMNISGITAMQDGIEIGVKTQINPKKNSEVYIDVI